MTEAKVKQKCTYCNYVDPSVRYATKNFHIGKTKNTFTDLGIELRISRLAFFML